MRHRLSSRSRSRWNKAASPELSRSPGDALDFADNCHEIRGPRACRRAAYQRLQPASQLRRNAADFVRAAISRSRITSEVQPRARSGTPPGGRAHSVLLAGQWHWHSDWPSLFYSTRGLRSAASGRACRGYCGYSYDLLQRLLLTCRECELRHVSSRRRPRAMSAWAAAPLRRSLGFGTDELATRSSSASGLSRSRLPRMG